MLLSSRVAHTSSRLLITLAHVGLLLMLLALEIDLLRQVQILRLDLVLMLLLGWLLSAGHMPVDVDDNLAHALLEPTFAVVLLDDQLD